jgi:NADH-quinone oxidoreductase subunit J
MSASVIIFYLLSVFTIVMGILSVTTLKIFRSAIWLLFTLVGIAGLYFWLQVEFIAAVQIIVYVGGIVVLIIFSIFLTQQTGTDMPKTSLKRRLFSILAVVFGFLFSFMLIRNFGFSQNGEKFDLSVSRIGNSMMNYQDGGFALPFEAVSILLLAAMIGCIVIALKPSTTK